MTLNTITPTGKWGEQASNLNDNFNKVAIAADSAARDAATAKASISSLDGLNDATTAAQTLAALTTQIQSNTTDIDNLEKELSVGAVITDITTIL